MRHSSHATKVLIRDDDPHYLVTSYKQRDTPRASNQTSTIIDKANEQEVAETLENEHALFVLDHINVEPDTYENAINGPNAEEWNASIILELASIRESGVFDEVDQVDIPEG